MDALIETKAENTSTTSSATKCPRCSESLGTSLTSGRQVCRRCGWSDKPREREEQNFTDELPMQEGIPNRVIEYLYQAWTDRGKVSKQKTNGKAEQQRSWLGLLGWIMFVWGMAAVVSGRNMDTTVAKGDLGITRTHNLGLLNEKLATIQAGGAMAICGAVFITGSRKRS